MTEEPDWLVAWRQGTTAPRLTAAAQGGEQGAGRGNGGTSAQPAPAPALPAVRVMQLAKVGVGVSMTGFSEPGMWAWDGGKRREPVLDHDHNPPRVVRSVGWRVCLKCCDPYFSQDVIGCACVKGASRLPPSATGRRRTLRACPMRNRRSGLATRPAVIENRVIVINNGLSSGASSFA